jgi:hypothetical protein
MELSLHTLIKGINVDNCPKDKEDLWAFVENCSFGTWYNFTIKTIS